MPQNKNISQDREKELQQNQHLRQYTNVFNLFEGSFDGQIEAQFNISEVVNNKVVNDYQLSTAINSHVRPIICLSPKNNHQY